MGIFIFVASSSVEFEKVQGRLMVHPNIMERLDPIRNFIVLIKTVL